MPVRLRWLVIVLCVLACSVGFTTRAEERRVKELVGLWKARRTFGPLLRGTLSLDCNGERCRATLAGHDAVGRLAKGRLLVAFPDGLGSFRGRLDSSTGMIRGHWIQPPPRQIGREVASPVSLERTGPGRFRGQVAPRESEFTFYLKIEEREDGRIGAFLRNPDRNLGIFYNLDRIERNGDVLELVGQFFRSSEEQVLLRGTYRDEGDRISIYIPWRGGTYDFERVVGDEGRGFYARSRNPGPYVYHRPRDVGDGWATASLDQVGIALAPLAEMIEKEIDPVAEDVHSHEVHGVLVARHGKLVFEEYFHGFHRAEPHDTRSASKSLTSVLVGAAIHDGAELDLDSPVYATILGRGAAADLEQRKQAMRLENLLTMASGFHCDDRDSEAPGNEDAMQSQEAQPDWYAYTLALPMVDEPGARPVYCSANSNLIGSVLAAATGEPLEESFARLIAGPLGIERYYLFLQPSGEPYMGGGIHWLPRDFMKLGQLMVDGGTWNGKRVVGREWVERSTTRQVELRGRGYGYQWWTESYPHRDRTVEAFFAGGNGGQLVVGIPELDLVIAFFGGNYSDRTGMRSQNVLVPNYILPAVDLDVGSP